MDEITLSDVAVQGGLISGPFGSNLVGQDYAKGGVPVIRGTNMVGPYVGGEFAFVTPEKFTNDLARNSVVPGDIVFTQRGTLGQVAMVPSDSYPEYVVSQSQMGLRVDNLVADAKFVYYACTDYRFRKQIHDNAISTGVPHINLGILARLTIPRFPRTAQRAIAEVLGALDDKIAANDHIRRIADELLAAVFDRMCAGSTQTHLSVIGSVNRAVTKPVLGGRLRYIDISSVGRGTFEFPDLMPWDDAPGRARRVVSGGDTVWSTVRPNRRSHALVLDDDPLLVASTGLAVLSPKPGRVAGLFEATKTDEFVSYLESVAEGSAYPAVRGDRFERAPIPDFSEDQWNTFEQSALPVRRRAHLAAGESRRLAGMRDALLPLLMSGKIQVKDAEALAADVT